MRASPIALALLWGAAASAQEKRPEMSLETRLVARVPRDHAAEHIAFSPDGRKAAYLAKLLEDTEWALYVGEKKQALRSPGHPAWSPDSARLACAAADGEKFCMTVDGKKAGASYDAVDDPVFSPDGSRLAYGAMVGDKHVMVVGDSRGEEFDRIGPPVWSPDSKRLAYWALRGDDSYVVVDGKKSEAYLGVVTALSGLVFSGDGRLAYIAARLVEDVPVYAVYLDGKRLFEVRNEGKEPYEGALGPVFAASGGGAGLDRGRRGRELHLRPGAEGGIEVFPQVAPRGQPGGEGRLQEHAARGRRGALLRGGGR